MAIFESKPVFPLLTRLATWRIAANIGSVIASERRHPNNRTKPASPPRPSRPAAKIALFVLDPHPKMPDMGLSRKEAADLTAYIATLKQTRRRAVARHVGDQLRVAKSSLNNLSII